MTLKHEATSGPWKVTSFIVITFNLEFNHVPKEESFPISLKYIDVTRATHIDLDVMQSGCAARAVLTIIGMFMGIELRQIRGHDSRSSRC